MAMRMDGKVVFRILTGLLLAAALLVPQPAMAQIGLGGFGGFGGGLGGLGGGLGGLGGLIGGGGNFQNAGVVVDAEGVLRIKMHRDPGLRLHRQRFEAAKAALNPELTRPSKLRKVSLTRLEKAVAQRLAAGEKLTEDMKYLAGLLKVQYVFAYPESGEIVIAGPAEGFYLDLAGNPRGMVSGRCVLELEDLVTALRAFPPGGPPTEVIGCSIDPTQEGLTRMQQFLASISGRIRPTDDVRIAEGLRRALGLQKVTIQGVSPKTHFAQVLVAADYRMKLIGIGLERPPVKIRSYVERANPRAVSRNALLRWYFVPHYEMVRVSQDELAMELVGWSVKLVGEDELVRPDGVRVEAGRTDRASQAFCEEFTRMYGALADRDPLFAQLRNLIDMSIAAAYIQQKDLYGKCGWSMEFFGDESQFPVETHETPRYVESAVNVVWKGNTLMTPIGGGVTIQPRQQLDPQHRLPDEGDQVQSLRSGLRLDSVPEDRWWWD